MASEDFSIEHNQLIMLVMRLRYISIIKKEQSIQLESLRLLTELVVRKGTTAHIILSRETILVVETNHVVVMLLKDQCYQKRNKITDIKALMHKLTINKIALKYQRKKKNKNLME